MSRSAVGYRDAGAHDTAFLCDLWSESLRRGSPQEQAADVEAVLARVAATPGERVVVSLVGDEPVGAVYLRLTTRTPLNLEPVVQILVPVVLPGMRRRGAGRALIDAAVSFAEDSGAAVVATAAFAGSRDVNRFLARLGFSQVATYRVAPTARVRARLRPAQSSRQGGGRPVGRVLAARRSMRRPSVVPPEIGLGESL